MSMSHLYGRRGNNNNNDDDDDDDDGVEIENFEVTEWDLANEFNPDRRRHRQTKEDTTYGIWAEHDSDEERPSFGGKRSKDYTAPVNFVSAGLRKTATEEREQQKQDSDDSNSDRDGVQPARESAPKKLQTQDLRPPRCQSCRAAGRSGAVPPGKKGCGIKAEGTSLTCHSSS